jgi:hypothetical protein
METPPAALSRADEAPSVSSSLGEAGPGEIALTFEGEDPAVNLSRLGALRLAARLQQVAEANRSAWAANSRLSSSAWGKPPEKQAVLNPHPVRGRRPAARCSEPLCR